MAIFFKAEHDNNKLAKPYTYTLGTYPSSLLFEPCRGLTNQVAARFLSSNYRSSAYHVRWAGNVDIQACVNLLSSLREASFWSKNALRSNLIASKFKNF